MNRRLISWQQDLDNSAIEEYNSLRRSLERNRGFGLFFVQCSPATGTNIVTEIKKDIRQKKIFSLKFDKPIDSLYNEIVEIPDIKNVDILFISGLEHSLLAYEEYTFGNSDRETYVNSKERYFRSKRGIPRFLGYLNLQRDRFKRDFSLSFVFLVPIFGIQYLIERTPDFFDWRSGLFRFIPNKNSIIKLNYEKLIQEDINQIKAELLDTKILAKELELNNNERLKILRKKSFLSTKCDRHKESIALLDDILALDKNDDWAWYGRGNILSKLKRYEEAVVSFDRYLSINPDEDSAWLYRGFALVQLERYKEAITSYNRSLEINPREDLAWFARGIAFKKLKRYEEEIISYDKGLEINPNNSLAWFDRGHALEELERYEEAVASYDRGLIVNPKNDFIWYVRGTVIGRLGKYGEAIASFDKCLEINPNNSSAWFIRAAVLGVLERYEEAIASFDKSLAIDSNEYFVWFDRGHALEELGRYEEAILSYDRGLAINSNDDLVWYDRSCCLALLNRGNLAIESLTKAIALNPMWQENAKTDSNFDYIRDDERFQSLVNSPLELSK